MADAVPLFNYYSMKQLILVPLMFLFARNMFAQHNSSGLLNLNLGYGTENNYGNTGFLVGIGGQKPLSRKFDLQADVNYFTTGIYNAYLKEKDFPGEERLYHN